MCFCMLCKTKWCVFFENVGYPESQKFSNAIAFYVYMCIHNWMATHVRKFPDFEQRIKHVLVLVATWLLHSIFNLNCVANNVM